MKGKERIRINDVEVERRGREGGGRDIQEEKDVRACRSRIACMACWDLLVSFRLFLSVYPTTLAVMPPILSISLGRG